MFLIQDSQILIYKNYKALKRIHLYITFLLITLFSCNSTTTNPPTQNSFVELLTNQVDNIIIPTLLDYQENINELNNSIQTISLNSNDQDIIILKQAFEKAYTSYQAAAVHNYFAVENQSLISNTNLFPIDEISLENFIANNSYNFSTTAQERANGFPALDYMIYSNGEIGFLSYLQEDVNRLPFMIKLIASMKVRADRIVDTWTGNLRQNFIDNGGTALGSSVSVQLNNTVIYYEEHIRENKVGLPVGLIGPNDSPIPPDTTKIESYYKASSSGTEEFTLSLLRSAIEEMEDIYLGLDDKGYDDLLFERDHQDIDEDIKELYTRIFNTIDNRESITGDDELYLVVQELVTIY